MTREEIIAEAEKYKWYHSIELVPGYKTKGVIDPEPWLPWYALPADMKGKRVLDIGCWDGFFSVECVKRGAEIVIASDSFAWGDKCWGDERACELTRLVSRDKQRMFIRHWDPRKRPMADQTIGQSEFDIALFLGVLYHLEDPMRVLRNVRETLKPGGLLILETYVAHELLTLNYPAARFFPGKELNGDPTNWWGPNPQCVHALLRATGFKTGHSAIRGDRLVVHAEAI